MDEDEPGGARTGQNVELKVRCADVGEVERRARAAGGTPVAVLHQRDTYFAAPRGRLKLREERRDPWPGHDGDAVIRAELVHYERADDASARGSSYELVAVTDPVTVARTLDERLGRVGVVEKVRGLLLWRGARVHLDDVEGLGSFVELEAVVGEAGDAVRCAELTSELTGLLGLADVAIEPRGYAGLLGLEDPAP